MKEIIEYCIDHKRRDEHYYKRGTPWGWCTKKFAISYAKASAKSMPDLKYRVVEQKRKIIKVFD